MSAAAKKNYNSMTLLFEKFQGCTASTCVTGTGNFCLKLCSSVMST